MMLQQGTGNAQHRFEICLDADGRRIYRGYSAMQAADEYAAAYTAGKLQFSADDREAGRGRDMGQPTSLYRVYPDGQRVVWRKYRAKDGTVVVTDTAEYKAEKKAQAERNEAARAKAEQAAAKQYQTRDNDMVRMAEIIGNSVGDNIGKLISALEERKSGAKPTAAPDK